MANVGALEPAICSTGFVGTLNLSDGTAKRFAVLLAEGLNSSEKSENLSAVHRQMTQQRLDEPPRSSDELLGTRSDDLSAAFVQPEDIALRSKNQIDNALIKGLKSFANRFTITCQNREVYAALCTAIGITRRDHIINAELSSLIDTESDRRGKIVGSAHKLRDLIRKERRRRPVVPDEDMFMVETMKNFIRAIPEAHKFYVGAYAADSVNVNAPENFRLPYAQCLFEGTTTIKEHGASAYGSYKHFYLATEVDKDAYIADVAIICPDKATAYHEALLRWDVSGDKLETSCIVRAEFLCDEAKASHTSALHFRRLLSAIERVNTPAVRLTLNRAPRALPQPGRRFKRSPYYDCYDLSMPSQGVPRLSQAFASSGRVVRAHERRAHDRMFTHERFVNMRGKTIRIGQSLVGDPTNGVLAKGYRLPAPS